MFLSIYRDLKNEIEQNPYTFDTINITGANPPVTWLNTCRLEYGGDYYPEVH